MGRGNMHLHIIIIICLQYVASTTVWGIFCWCLYCTSSIENFDMDVKEVRKKLSSSPRIFITRKHFEISRQINI